MSLKFYFQALVSATAICLLMSCGGGGGGSSSSSTTYGSTNDCSYTLPANSSSTGSTFSVPNPPTFTLPVTMTNGNGNPNLPKVSVTVCQPNSTSHCQVVNDVLLDTGSYGLRLFSGGSSLNLNLTQSTLAGQPLFERTDFISGSVWGSVVNADVYLAAQKAANIPIQVIQSSVPSCLQSTTNFYTSSTSLGANGILGIGPLLQDCGTSCVNSATNSPYYTYNSSTGLVSKTKLPLSYQVPNPVSSLTTATYNNGIQMDLTGVRANAPTATTGLTLGAPSSLPNGAVQMSLDANGDFITRYRSVIYTSFIDSGSNAYYIPDSSISSCTGSQAGYYCPSSLLAKSADIDSSSNSWTTVSFTIANYANQFSNSAVLPNLGGYLGSYFDWGLPFFYVHKVFITYQTQDDSGTVTSYGSTAFTPSFAPPQS
jgi:hypothetical protein